MTNRLARRITPPSVAQKPHRSRLVHIFPGRCPDGFGPFVAVYLTAAQWTQQDIGFILSVYGHIRAPRTRCRAVPSSISHAPSASRRGRGRLHRHQRADASRRGRFFRRSSWPAFSTPAQIAFWLRQSARSALAWWATRRLARVLVAMRVSLRWAQLRGRRHGHRRLFFLKPIVFIVTALCSVRP